MNVAVAVDLLLALLTQAGRISQLVQLAQAEGRDELTPQEWQDIENADTAARGALVSAIEKAKAEGR